MMLRVLESYRQEILVSIVFILWGTDPLQTPWRIALILAGTYLVMLLNLGLRRRLIASARACEKAEKEFKQATRLLEDGLEITLPKKEEPTPRVWMN